VHLFPALASLWTVPIIVVVDDECSVFLDLGAVVPRVSIISADFACGGRVFGLSVVVHVLLVFRPLVQAFQKEVHLCSKHVHLLDGVHALDSGL
jgi:hypothetical protein